MGKWKTGGKDAPQKTPTIPYVGTWSTFSKLDDKEKSVIFNAMRSQLLEDGRMKRGEG